MVFISHKKDKRGRNILTGNIVFIILNVTFLSILMIFVFSRTGYIGDGNAPILEERTAKQIAMALNYAKPSMMIEIEMIEAIEKSKIDDPIKINQNMVNVKLSERSKGYTYSFFNNIEVSSYYLNDGNTGYVFIIGDYISDTDKIREYSAIELAETIERFEGREECVYVDIFGVPTIGVGFNLEKEGARERIESLGLDYNLVISGEKCFESKNDPRINTLLLEDVEIAINDAKLYLGENKFNKLHPEAQKVIIDMAFNLGLTRLRGFVNLKEALIENPPNYEKAANEMRNSEWYNQVGRRSAELVNKMENLA